MEYSRWLRLDHLNRLVHLYTGMFLVPWMIVYALSAFLLNHSTLFFAKYQSPQKWEIEREVSYSPSASLPYDDDGQARAVLSSTGLEGPYRLLGVPDSSQLTLLRFSVAGHYRITWQRANNRVVVERLKPANWYSSINNLHFVMGYGQSSWITFTWAVIVDSVAISTILWVATGIYIWARRRQKRLAGGLCLATGCLLFAVLAVMLSQ